MSLFTNLLKKYPDKDWNMDAVSSNPNISLDFIRDNPNIKWSWFNGVSYNPNLTCDFVNEYNKRNWNWKYLSQHLSMNKEFIDKNKNNINFKYLSRNKHISILFISKTKYPWHINGGLTHNPNLRFRYVIKNIFLLWCIDLLSENPNMSLNDIEKYDDFNWNWSKIIKYNENITIEFVHKYIKKFKYKDLHYLSNKKNITMEDIENNPSFPWNYGKNGISSNPNLTLPFLQNNFFDKKNEFDIYTICSHPNFDLEILKNNINIFNCMRGISANPNLTAKYINKNLNLEGFNGKKYDLINFYYFSNNHLTKYRKNIEELKEIIELRRDLFDSLNDNLIQQNEKFLI